MPDLTRFRWLIFLPPEHLTRVLSTMEGVGYGEVTSISTRSRHITVDIVFLQLDFWSIFLLGMPSKH